MQCSAEIWILLPCCRQFPVRCNQKTQFLCRKCPKPVNGRGLNCRNLYPSRLSSSSNSASYRQIMISRNELQCYFRSSFGQFLLKSRPKFRYVGSLPQFLFWELRFLSGLLRCTNDLPQVPICRSICRSGRSPAISQQSAHFKSPPDDAFP